VKYLPNRNGTNLINWDLIDRNVVIGYTTPFLVRTQNDRTMVGKTLSHYKILEELGRGGMGIVYKGEDTKLHRTVAIKVLPAAALSSDDDRARFYREARAAASLSHPNIATVYEIDEAVPEGSKDDDLRPFIAMEFIEGETLEGRIKQGPMKLEEAVRIASEIAEGLRAAHAKDIVHRDIKAANVMMDGDGRAKILDFGLAQTAQSTKLTRMGSTLGTVAYMSPEQARGEEVDARTDLWALGVTLYEMIAGRHPFGGDYEQAVVYSIMNEDPEPLTAVRTGVPMGLEWIVSKCLSKKAADRYQTGTDLLVDFRNVDLTTSGMSRLSGALSTSQSSHTRVELSVEKDLTVLEATKRAWPVVASLFALALILSYFVLVNLGVSSSAESATDGLHQVEIYLEGYSNVDSPAISPTSEYLSFTGSDTLGNSGLFLYEFATRNISLVRDSRGAETPKFSPDGSKLAFIQRGQGSVGIYTTTVPFGVPEMKIPDGGDFTWESDHSILHTYMGTGRTETARFDLVTGKTEVVIQPDSSSTEKHKYPIYSVDVESGIGIGSKEISGEDPTLFWIDLDSPSEPNFFEPGGVNPKLVPGGFIAYQLNSNNGQYVVRRFNIHTRKFEELPSDLLPEITSSAIFVGTEGSLLYVPGSLVENDRTSELMIYNSDGDVSKSLEFLQEDYPYLKRPQFSPDGTKLLFEHGSSSGSAGSFSVYDLENDVLGNKSTRTRSYEPTWSPDGRHIYFVNQPDSSSTFDLYRRTVDGSAEPNLAKKRVYFGPIFSPDERWLLYLTEDQELVLYDLKREQDQWKEQKSGLHRLSFSSDGNYLSYHDQGENGLEIVIRSTVNGARFPFDQPGAENIVWSADNSKIYFAVGQEGIYSVPIETNPGFRVTGSRTLELELQGSRSDQAAQFDINSEGEIVVFLAKPYVGLTNDNKPYSTIMWRQNWAQSLQNE